jgi:hypothetical protein
MPEVIALSWEQWIFAVVDFVFKYVARIHSDCRVATFQISDV